VTASPTTPPPVSARPNRSRFVSFGPLIAAGVLFVALATYLRLVEHTTLPAASAAADSPLARSALPPITVDRLVQAAKLVTVELDAAVTAQATDESWRGGVDAKVTVPVRYSYGVDLSALQPGDIAYTRLLNTYRVRVPAPKRLSMEIRPDAELSATVQLGWARFRSRAGEYYLNVARRGLYAAAARYELDDQQRDFVERATRERLEALVRAIAGKDVSVSVSFAETER
jgi:hypothetical protein